MQGFVRARVDGAVIDLQKELPLLDKQKKHSIDVLVDRLVVKPGLAKRLADSLETALKVGGVLVVVAPEGQAEETLSQNFSCASCGTSLSEITPRLFSFNSPYGACATCSGLGTLMGVDQDKVVIDPERSISAGGDRALPAGRQVLAPAHDRDPRQGDAFLAHHAVAEAAGEGARQVILHGSGEAELTFEFKGRKSSYQWDAALPGPRAAGRAGRLPARGVGLGGRRLVRRTRRHPDGRAHVGPGALVRAVGGRAPVRPRGRRSAGHEMAKFRVQGADAGEMLDRVSAGAVSEKAETITYTQWHDEDGRIEGDLTVTKLGEDDFLVVASDTAHGHTSAWLARHAGDADCTVTDVTADYGQLNVQGPRSREPPRG